MSYTPDPAEAPAALHGVRVLDLSTETSGAIAAMWFADYGAEVVRVTGPDSPGLEHDALWQRNKAILALDPAREAGAVELRHLLAGADCLVVNQPPSAVLAAVSAELSDYPHLVSLTMPPFATGCDWPLAGESAEFAAALGGIARRQSSVGGGPIECVFPHVTYVHGLWGATVAVAALLERASSGRGQVCEVDGMHAVLALSTGNLTIDPAAPAPDTRVGPSGPNPAYSTYLCADGRWIFFGALTPKFQDIGFEALGISPVLRDKRVGGNRANLFASANRDWVRQAIADAFARLPRQHWLTVLRAVGCPVGPVEDRASWLDHPQVVELGLRRHLTDSREGSVELAGPPVTMSRTPPRASGARVLEQAPDWQPRTLRPGPGSPAVGASGMGPLHGLRILDLGAVAAGPYAGTLLAELGADVVKVEPLAGDNFRTIGFVYNRGQRSLAIDLRDGRGRTAFVRLAAVSDAVIDNFRPGVLERLRLDYDSLRKAARPDIVTLSISAYADVGPHAGEPGFDPVLQAMSGMMAAQGGTAEPVFNTLAVNDVTAACASAFGVCAALLHRISSGHGQRVAVTLTGISAYLQSGEIARYAGRPEPRVGDRDYPGPSDLDRFYATKDGYLRLRARHAAQLADAGLLSGPVPADLGAALARSLASRTTAEALAGLRQAGVPAVPALTYPEIVSAGWAEAGHYLERHTGANGLSLVLPGRYARFSRTERTKPIMPPGIGEHSLKVLIEAGLDWDTVDELLVDGVIAKGDPMTAFTVFSYR